MPKLEQILKMTRVLNDSYISEICVYIYIYTYLARIYTWQETNISNLCFYTEKCVIHQNLYRCVYQGRNQIGSNQYGTLSTSHLLLANT